MNNPESSDRSSRTSHALRPVFLLPALVIVGFGLYGGVTMGQRLAGGHTDDYSFFDELVEVKQLISQRYVDAPDEKAMREGAIKGMVESLNDPYTIYVPASDQQNFTKDLTGEYVGIGAQVNTQNGWLTIVSPLEDSPAFRAGLMADDRVTEIDGKTTQNMSIDDCIKLLLGEPDTKVKLTIERKGEKLPIEITRERIKTRSVKGFHRSPTDPEGWDYLIDPARSIAYVRLTQFTPDCSKEVLDALKSVGAEQGKLKGLVLDLRFNPGGLLNEAEEIADDFLESGIIVSTRGRAHEEVVRRANKDGTLPNFPIAILLNGSSASASEVLSGALVENNRAIVVGQRSFGKGTVQSVIELPSGHGSELKMTEQGYYLPSGRSLTRKDNSPTWGVDPTDGFYVPMSDEQLVAMLEVRRKQEVLHAKGEQAGGTSEKWSDPAWVLDYLKDPQLTAAVQAMQAKVDTGEWKKTGEAVGKGTPLAAAELTRLRDYHERLLKEITRAEKRIDTLETADPNLPKDEAKANDLWPDDIDVKGGTLEVKDKSGKIVATLEITGSDLEQALEDASVKKKSEGAADGNAPASPKSEPKKDDQPK
ncbi:MAG: PDZ domain-containing protein [Tepidisphaera sp.]|nr:PDZ domain-containing protein [Tepidisphaera sp.]